MTKTVWNLDDAAHSGINLIANIHLKFLLNQFTNTKLYGLIFMYYQFAKIIKKKTKEPLAK